MIEKYLVDYSGITVGVKYDPGKKILTVGGKQRCRAQILFFLTDILEYAPDTIGKVVFRQGNKIRYIVKSPTDTFYSKIDSLVKSPLDITVKDVDKIHTSVM